MSAIEDAAVLASAAARFTDPARILAEYDRARRPRSQAIARMSACTGRISSGLRNPVAAALRDTAMRLIPARAARRNIAKIASWSMDPLGSSTE